MSELNIGIILGSTRPGRLGPLVGEWVKNTASASGARFELVDLQDYSLPLLEEPWAVGAGNYTGDAANAWASKLGEFDGFIFVTAEYNHSIPAALKNAIDYVKDEWANKSAGIVSYGSMGGVRAGEHLRQVLGELQVADVRQTVMFSLFTDFTGISDGTTPGFAPAEPKAGELQTLVDQVVTWGRALRSVREDAERIAA